MCVFDTLNGDDSTIIVDITFIASNYGLLQESIEKLESCGQPLHANIKIVTYIMNIITSINDTAANPIKEKLSTVIGWPRNEKEQWCEGW